GAHVWIDPIGNDYPISLVEDDKATVRCYQSRPARVGIPPRPRRRMLIRSPYAGGDADGALLGVVLDRPRHARSKVRTIGSALDGRATLLDPREAFEAGNLSGVRRSIHRTYPACRLAAVVVDR